MRLRGQHPHRAQSASQPDTLPHDSVEKRGRAVHDGAPEKKLYENQLQWETIHFFKKNPQRKKKKQIIWRKRQM